jgi:hypothetical protein
MRTSRIFIWLLIATFAFVVGVLTSPVGQGHNSMQRQPTKLKVLRRKDQLAFKPTAKEIQEQEPPQLERILDNQIPKHVPLKIKVKNEKTFKDLSNDKWARDFQLEVTNTGDKPIYEFYLLLVTDVKAAAGYRIVAPLTYGRPELANLKERPTKEDDPIQPGETHILTIHPSQLEAWEHFRKKENRPLPRKVQIKLQGLSFGDGTGYIGNEGVPLPRSSQPSGSGACIEPRNRSDPMAYAWDSLASLNESELTPSNSKPAIVPVNFLSGKFTSSLAAKPQGCCSGINCTSRTPWSGIVCVNCPPQNRPSVTFCSDPLGACLSEDYASIECFTKSGAEPYLCQTIDLLPCSGSPSSSPTPTPSPSPSPTPIPTPEGCDPNTRPNSTNCLCMNFPGIGPVWSCSCLAGGYADYTVFPQNGGCDPSKIVNNGSNCCVCINQGPCAPGSYRNSFSCECEPTTAPTPAPTPPATSYVYQSMCTEYWWVLYECIPVGENDWDCHEVDRWYAGCLQV